MLRGIETEFYTVLRRVILMESMLDGQEASPRRMIIFSRVGSCCFPTRFLIPIHIIVYMTWCVILHTAPNAYIPLDTVPELFFPCLLQIQYTLFSVSFNQKLIYKDWKGERKVGEGEENVGILPCPWSHQRHLALMRTGLLSYR